MCIRDRAHGLVGLHLPQVGPGLVLRAVLRGHAPPAARLARTELGLRLERVQDEPRLVAERSLHGGDAGRLERGVEPDAVRAVAGAARKGRGYVSENVDAGSSLGAAAGVRRPKRAKPRAKRRLGILMFRSAPRWPQYTLVGVGHRRRHVCRPSAPTARASGTRRTSALGRSGARARVRRHRERRGGKAKFRPRQIFVQGRFSFRQ